MVRLFNWRTKCAQFFSFNYPNGTDCWKRDAIPIYVLAEYSHADMEGTPTIFYCFSKRERFKCELWARTIGTWVKRYGMCGAVIY